MIFFTLFLPFLLAFWILFLLPVSILTLVQKYFALKHPIGYILTCLMTAALFALIGFFSANIYLEEHAGFLDTPTLIIVYSIVGVGILFGAGIGIPLFSSIREFTSPSTGGSRSVAAIPILLLSFLVAIGLCAILWLFLLWTGG